MVLKVAEVMTHRVIAVTPDVSIVEAANLMLQAKVSGLPVVDDSGKLAGIVTEGDFLRRAELGTAKRRPRWLEFVTSSGKLAEEFVRAHGRKVSKIMTPDPHTVTEDTPLADAVDLMERQRIKRLPVLRDGKPVGMVTRANLLRGLIASAQPEDLQQTDRTIRNQILGELKKQPWAPVYAIDVRVRKGVVDLHGTILDERERNALIVVAENTPGVKEVRDHIALIEPRSGMLVYQPDEESLRATGR
jgi:CBS domain-containing protein